MRVAVLSTIIIQLAILPSATFAACTHAVGDVVEMLSPVTVAEQMSDFAVVKDEFETTKEFDARKEVALEKLPSGTMVVEATYNPEHAIYNADAKTFSIKSYAWHNISGYFSDSIPSIEESDYNFRAIGLQHQDKVVEIYKSSNAYGKEVEVAKISRNVYGIFDNKYKWSGPHISLTVPREQARILKTEMRFGIEFTPKEPYLFQGKNYYEPTTNNPKEVITEVSSISGTIECVIITDAKGTVLKAVGIAP